MKDSLGDMVIGLHHVAIAVPSIEEARRIYVAGLGLREGEVEHVPDQKVNVLICHGGDQRIELVEPAAEDSPITKFLARTGGGLHHVAWQVADLEAALAHVKAQGFDLIHEEPRPGAHGMRIAFLHPRSTGGVLTELVEVPASAAH